MSRPSRSYAIIPAAGRSERMGRSKLLLSWRRGGDANSTLLAHVLRAWTTSRVQRTVIVIRTDADPAVKQICHSHDVEVVTADNPADMKASCLLGLQHLARHDSSGSDDRFFVCPVDIPGITSGVVDRLIGEGERGDTAGEPARVIVPTYQGRRGHPVLFPWTMASQIELLNADQGINFLVDRAAVAEVEFPVAPEKMADIDTPEEYAAALRRMEQSFE